MAHLRISIWGKVFWDHFFCIIFVSQFFSGIFIFFCTSTCWTTNFGSFFFLHTLLSSSLFE